MSLAALLAIILGASLSIYAVLAGADFGAGVLDLQANLPDVGAGDRDSSDRDAIAASIGPLWEANHVWLIFSITILFSAFPRAFSAIGSGLLAPFTVALLAIVVRGVSLGVRGSTVSSPRSHRLLSRAFGLASLIAPFAFGTIAGGLAEASFTVPSRGAEAPAIPWSSPFALVVGVLAVAVCAQLAAGFVTLRCTSSGQPAAAERFCARALRSAVAVLLLMLLALMVAALSAPALWHRLVGVALPAVVGGLAAETLALVALARRSHRVAHAAGVGSAVLLLWGWFIAQAPHIAGPRLTLHTAAAAHPALVAAALAVGAVLVVVIPAFLFLFTLFSRPVLEVIE
jgi:cytochrome bd ubiquinol oxidase subunit II